MSNLKNTSLKIIIFGAVIVILCSGYWIWIRTIHWKSGPVANLSQFNYSQVYWENPVIYELAKKRVILIVLNKKTIVSDPSVIREFVRGLLKSKQYWFSSRPLAGTDVGFVFEDGKTGMMFQMHIDIDAKLVQGEDWDSKDLYPLLVKIMHIDEDKIKKIRKDLIEKGWKF